MGKSFISIMMFILVVPNAFSQSENQQLDFNLQLKNIHFSRGFTVTNTPVLTGHLHYNSKDRHFRAGVWGGTGLTGVYREFDYYLSYQYKGFRVALWDVYNFSTNETTYNTAEIFNYTAHKTGRFLDLTVACQFTERFPLQVSWSTVVFGRDRGELNQKNLYSTYVLLSYAILPRGPVTATVFAGGVLALNPEKGSKANFYTSKSTLVNLGLTVSKTVKIGGYDWRGAIMPAWNPGSNDGNIQLALTIF